MRFEHISDKKVWARAKRHIGKNDKVMGRLIDRVNMPGMWALHTDYYEALVHSIVFQQISGAAGNAILKKLRGLYGGRLPKPRQFLAARPAKIRGAGISPQKYSYIKDICERIEDGRLELEKFHAMPDDAVVRELDDVKGIGRWTAEMFLMFSLGRVDVWPVDDLGIRKAVRDVYGFRSMPAKSTMERLGEKWRPYRSIAAMYLWHANDNGTAGIETKDKPKRPLKS